ncbi:hypothetical protein DJ010_19255 [Nocardioides silvaticus]|uniref:DUF6318 domain-containing protein n=1 Tax=Nocardioides silvaticus TaxID=2201891 RepID=A0A316TA75_9ACTN|nr:DUF6318 family protein [Nocardioides silvaticus]PWN01300.1 hypothetical protein DJ010_19255 [Nocardioides silvaticus]
MALAACEEEDRPTSPAPSDTPSVPESSLPNEPTTTATETGPVEPTLPAEAKKESEAGVEAFVRFYFSVINYATKSGDVDLLARLHQPSCAGCEAGVEGIKRVYGRGGRIVGSDYTIARLEPTRSDSEHWAVVTHTRLGEQRTIGAGDMNRSFEGGKAKWLVSIARVRGDWSVTTLEVL